MRQDFVPRISFDAKLEVTVPDFARNSLLHERRRHMVVEFVVTCDGVSQRGEEFAWAFKDFGDGIDESLVITSLMPFDRWKDRRHDIRRAALLCEKNLNARARRLRCLNKDKLVFVRNDHETVPGSAGSLPARVGSLPTRPFSASFRKQQAGSLCYPAICRTASACPPLLAQFGNAP